MDAPCWLSAALWSLLVAHDRYSKHPCFAVCSAGDNEYVDGTKGLFPLFNAVQGLELEFLCTRHSLEP